MINVGYKNGKKYFIYEKDTANGILINAEKAKGWSEYIKNMVDDV